MDLKRYSDVSVFLLRVALGAIFLWFGIMAIVDPEAQLSWMSSWVLSLPIVGTTAFIMAFGIIQTIIGLCLILGVYVRYAALAAAFALVGVIVNLGFNDIAFRDVVILTAALVLATQQRHRWAAFPG